MALASHIGDYARKLWFVRNGHIKIENGQFRLETHAWGPLLWMVFMRHAGAEGASGLVGVAFMANKAVIAGKL